MSWQGSPAFDFALRSVFYNAPWDSGVYVILSRKRWLYVGASPSIRGSLLRHLSGGDPRMRQHQPTHFMFERVSAADRVVRQWELIQEFQPVCN
jgi:hypothetical protein